MSKHISGRRRSSKQTFRRRIIIFRTLFSQPSTAEELIAAVNNELAQDGYPAAAAMALKHDLDALKSEFSCEITFDRNQKTYTLHSVGDFAVLDLSRESLEALAFLDTNFPEDHMLAAFINVQKLLRQVRMLLPHVSSASIPSIFKLHSPIRQHKSFDNQTLRTVKRAIENKQQLRFLYMSNFEQHEARRHTVAPYGLFMRDGHMYLDAVMMNVEPAGHALPMTSVEYRLERIIKKSAQLLPIMNPPERPPQPRYHLVYRLDPVVARRRDLATFFNDSMVDYHEDGSATITASVTNLWTTRQVLLRYGGTCEVLSPPELVSMLRETITQMAEKYNMTKPSTLIEPLSD
ncbi:MAG: WYL domain-containing protein [Chloroflexi bacterium]|nr:WYL domain-containing protein [Chloroflexota bacterium]